MELSGLNNTTLVPPYNQTHFGSSFSPIFDTFIVLLALVIIGINGLVINLFICKSSLQEVTNYFLVSLAISDGLTGLLVIPIYVSCTVSNQIGACFSFDTAHRLTGFATVYHLLLITCDRYVAITRPFKHNRIVTSSVAITLIIFVWCVSLFLPLIQLVWYNVDNLAEYGPDIARYELHYDLTCLFLALVAPVIIMMIAYMEMLRIVTRHARAIEATTRERLVLSKEKRAMVIFATMLFIYVVCWSSFFLSALNDDQGENRIHLPQVLRDVLFFFRFCTSVFNPLLYVFFKTDFKKAFRETMMQFRHCKGFSNGARLQTYSLSNNEGDVHSTPLATRFRTTRLVER